MLSKKHDNHRTPSRTVIIKRDATTETLLYYGIPVDIVEPLDGFQIYADGEATLAHAVPERFVSEFMDRLDASGEVQLDEFLLDNDDRLKYAELFDDMPFGVYR